MSARWTDLRDPTQAEVDALLPAGVDPDVIEELVAPAREHDPRPVIEDHGSYVFGVLVPFLATAGESQPLEVCFVATPDRLLTVRKSASSGAVFDTASLEAADRAGKPVGALVQQLVDDTADTCLDMLDALYAQIDGLEDRIDDLRPAPARTEIAELRHTLLHRRRIVAATRASVRKIVDGRIEVGDPELFPPAIERLFADTYDTLVRVTEELDVARDLLSGVRDHMQSKITESQNDVAKKLTVIASLVLVPSFVVGFFGQNFEGVFDQDYWTLWFSTSVIVVSTLVQLAIYRWRRWI